MEGRWVQRAGLGLLVVRCGAPCLLGALLLETKKLLLGVRSLLVGEGGEFLLSPVDLRECSRDEPSSYETHCQGQDFQTTNGCGAGRGPLAWLSPHGTQPGCQELCSCAAPKQTLSYLSRGSRADRHTKSQKVYMSGRSGYVKVKAKPTFQLRFPGLQSAQQWTRLQSRLCAKVPGADDSA